VTEPGAKSPRILHAPVDIGGHASGLAAAQRRLGLDAVCMSLYPSLHSSEPVIELAPVGSGAAWRELNRWKLFWGAVRHFEIIHLYFGESLLMPRRHPDLRSGKPLTAGEMVARIYARLVWGKDLPVLKLLGKRLAFSFLGDDVRLQRYTLSTFDVSIAKYADRNYYPAGSDLWKERIIALAARYGHAVFAYNPDLLNNLPDHAQFIPYSHIFPNALKPVLPEKGASLRLAHAPTHTGAKGTQFILEAVEALRNRGMEFEFDLIEHVPHQEAMKRIARADLFIDQLLAGWYGGSAVEAMLAAVPVVAYIRDQDLGRVPQQLIRELPIFSAKPDTVFSVLGDLLARGRDWLHERGLKCRAFAERYHDPFGVARQVAESLHLTRYLSA
jgi:hypothetical protein